MFIDFHMHAFPDELAERAIQKLISSTDRTRAATDGTVADTEQKLEDWQVDYGVLLNIATKPAQTPVINRWCLTIQQPRIIPFGTIHPLYEHWKEELCWLKEHGIKGIKLHLDFQRFMVDDPILYPIYDACSQLGLPVVIHAGYDPVSPKLIHTPPERSVKLLKNFPQLTLVLAHMGGMLQWDDVDRYLVGKQVYFDTAYCAEHLDADVCCRMIQKHGADKILLGSDCPWSQTDTHIQYIDRMPLTDRQKELIFSGNAQRLLGL